MTAGSARPVDVARAPGERRHRRSEFATADATEAFGARLAELLRPGDVVVLRGPLGAGKTALARGIGRGLGVDGPVVSPTFVIARVHPGGRVPMVHVDAYRLGGVAELDDLDLDLDVDTSVTVVEWGSGVAEQLADEHLVVDIVRRDDDVRVVTLEPHGAGWEARV